MGALISETQSGFMKGRQITESILIANEVEHALKVGKVQGIILKLDFEKAFDSVDWDFPLNAMIDFDFEQNGQDGLKNSTHYESFNSHQWLTNKRVQF